MRSPRFSPFAVLLVLLLGPLAPASRAQTSTALAPDSNAKLQYVVVLSRHGVRSSLGSAAELNQYSAAPWPKWEVPPGILTPHGHTLMKLFGEWDRIKFASAGLLASSGCADAPHVTVISDTDERDRETSQGLLEGMLPGCTPPTIQALSEPANDPLFRSLEAGIGRANYALADAAISGRIGGDPNNVTAAYRPQLVALDHVLAGCGRTPSTNHARKSILDVPASINPGDGDRPASARGPLFTAASMAEDLLLEYTDGKPDAEVGWGCVDGATLRSLMQVDGASWQYNIGTRPIAQMKASNLLDHIEESIAQNATGKPVAGAIGAPGDRVLFLVGHDTNIATVAGALGLDWIVDGRVDDTPPGGALLFELWRSQKDGKLSVRLEYIAQTLEQMRQAQPLTQANPPAQDPIFVPGCTDPDLSCSLDEFHTVMNAAIDPAYVGPAR